MLSILCYTFFYNEQIGKSCCRISKIRLYMNILNWENINFPPQEQDHNTLEMNNKSIALNILQYNNKKVIVISLILIEQEKIK